MATEHALLFIDPNRADQFEAAVEGALVYLTSSEGFQGARLLRGVESPGTYLLLVEWATVEAHMVGFRQSPAFADWRAAIGEYFVSPPDVEHFETRAMR